MRWMIDQMRTISPREIVRVNRRDVTRQLRNRPPTTLTTPLVPPMHRTIIIHMYNRRSRDPPRIALPKLHVVILASFSRLVRAAPLGHFARADRDEGSDFATLRAATVATEGELAGDFGGEVAEEAGNGDEAAADDAGCDLGNTIDCAVRLTRCSKGGNFKLTSIMRRETDNRSCRDFWRWQRL